MPPAGSVAVIFNLDRNRFNCTPQGFKLEMPAGEEFFVLSGTAAASGRLPRPSNGHPVGRREMQWLRGDRHGGSWAVVGLTLGGQMSAYQTLVVGTDGSDSSLRAVDRAGAIAADHGAKLIVATAHPLAPEEHGGWSVPPGSTHGEDYPDGGRRPRLRDPAGRQGAGAQRRGQERGGEADRRCPHQRA